MYAQIFEAYGLGKDVVDLCFKGSVSRIGGMSLADLQRESESFWSKAFPDKAMTKLEDYGFIQSKAKVRGRDSWVLFGQTLGVDGTRAAVVAGTGGDAGQAAGAAGACVQHAGGRSGVGDGRQGSCRIDSIIDCNTHTDIHHVMCA